MYSADELNIGRLMTAIPSEYWTEAQAIRNALNLYESGEHLKELQKIALVFSLGSAYGEDLAIRRIRYLEKQVEDLTDYNRRVTAALQEAVRENQSTQDTKIE